MCPPYFLITQTTETCFDALFGCLVILDLTIFDACVRISRDITMLYKFLALSLLWEILFSASILLCCSLDCYISLLHLSSFLQSIEFCCGLLSLRQISILHSEQIISLWWFNWSLHIWLLLLLLL